MEYTLRKKLLLYSICLVCAALSITFVRSYNGKMVSATTDKKTVSTSETPVKDVKPNTLGADILGDKYIRIAKPESCEIEAEAEDVYGTTKILIDVKGLSDKDLSENSIERIFKDQYFFGAVLAENQVDPVRQIALHYEYDLNNFTYIAHFELDMNTYYVPEIKQDDVYVYFKLLAPKDVYDKIVVIDAGHGGNDTGTYSSDLKHVESTYTLELAKHVKDIFADSDIKAYFTRLKDVDMSLPDRAKMANELGADYFISIHLNGSDTNASESFGMEALYYNHDSYDSKALANSCLTEVITATERFNRGLQKRKDLYLLKNTDMPSVILELGFMCNTSDMKYVKKDANQKKIAKGIYNGILDAYSKNIH